MRCLQCGHSNPDSNKFCGECGTRLEHQSVTNRESVPVASLEEFQLRDTQRERVRDSAASVAKTEPVILSSVIVKTDFPPATPEEEAEEEKATVAADTSEGRQMRAGISGPSILGLGYETAANPKGFIYDKPRNDGFIYDTDGSSPEYLLEEEPGRSASWRAWALLAVLVIAGVLGYLQWRANRGEGPDLMSMVRSYTAAALNKSSAAKGAAAANGPSTSANSATPATTDSATPQAPPDGASTQQTPSQSAEQTNSAAASAQNSPSTAATTPQPDPAANQSSSTLSSDSEEGAPPASSSAPPATPKQQSAVEAGTQSSRAAPQSTQEDKSAESSTQDDEDANAESNKSESESTAPKAAAVRTKAAVPAKPKPLGDKDPLIIRAENYIQGRGGPKNCSAAVNLLRESVSQGNPAADVKLGALYWSGTCVTQSKVTAYRWFTRAHELEPTNRWVERSRNSMWASMSEQEKRLAASY